MTRMTRRIIALALVALVGSTLLSSCGDDDERLSKAEFSTELSALCKTRDKKTDKLLDNSNFFDMKIGEKTWSQAKAPIQDYLDAVNDLNPPEDADAMMDRYETEGDDVLSRVDDAIDSAKDRDQKAYSQALGALFTDFSTIDKPVGEYGVKDCYSEDEQFPLSERAAKDATVVEIGAKEYAFAIPSDIEAGKTALKLTNNGNELHIFGFGRLKVRAAEASGGERRGGSGPPRGRGPHRTRLARWVGDEQRRTEARLVRRILLPSRSRRRGAPEEGHARPVRGELAGPWLATRERRFSRSSGSPPVTYTRSPGATSICRTM
jgi:hypothetical protein